MRIAVVDVGTNTTRLYVAEVGGGSHARGARRISRVTRLGAGVDASGRLADDALEREYAVLADYRRQIDTPAAAAGRGGDDQRRARRRQRRRVRRTVADRFGLETHVITGDEEAR